jgi:hypothetical protein
MNSVIHQNGMLSRNQSQKLWPLFLAMIAGRNAATIHAIIRNIVQNAVSVAPRIVVANIFIPPLLLNLQYPKNNSYAVSWVTIRILQHQRTAGGRESLRLFADFMVRRGSIGFEFL